MAPLSQAGKGNPFTQPFPLRALLALLLGPLLWPRWSVPMIRMGISATIAHLVDIPRLVADIQNSPYSAFRKLLYRNAGAHAGYRIIRLGFVVRCIR